MMLINEATLDNDTKVTLDAEGILLQQEDGQVFLQYQELREIKSLAVALGYEI